MNDYLKRNINKMVAVFLLMQPILDLLTGICVNTLKVNLTIGIFVRMIFLLLIVYVVLFVFHKKKFLIPYLLLGLYFFFYAVVVFFFHPSGFLFEIKNLLRTFYFPVMLLSFFAIRDSIRISDMTLFTMLGIYLFLIFVPTIFGVGYQTYQITKSGTLGFFNSANEISGILSILTPILFLIFYRFQKIWFLVLFGLVYFFVILNVGTKTPLLSLGITIGVSILSFFKSLLKKREWKKMFLSFLVLLFGCCSFLFLLPKTNFYKNIRVHLDYLGLEHVSEVFQNRKVVDHFIFSSRLQFMKHKAKIYAKSNVYEKLFGIGYWNDNSETKLIEMDYFDIFYSHGLLGFLFYFSIVFSVLYEIFSHRKRGGFENLMRYVSFSLIVFLAFFTGHIITAPAVSYVVVVLLFSLMKREKRDLLFADYSLAIGGIENAQVHFLDRIDYEEYSVTLILEKKEGELLERVNPNVSLREIRVSDHPDILLRKAINFWRVLWFGIFEYHNYDFSCCYTTYSYRSNVIARLASSNSSFYVHSDYQYVYDTEEEIRQFFDTRHLLDFHRIIFVSRESQSSFLKWYPTLKDRTYVFNNFIDISRVREKSLDNISVKKKRGSKLLVFVGRLDDASKKVKRAIQLVSNIDKLELWIVGDGPDRKMYEDYVQDLKLEDRVSFFGVQINPYPYMREADYIILTSDYEGFPVTYLEAICLERAIITTIPTSDDYLDIRDCAFIVSKDPKKMVSEVQEILKKPVKKKKIDLEEIQKKRMEKWMEIFNES